MRIEAHVGSLERWDLTRLVRGTLTGGLPTIRDEGSLAIAAVHVGDRWKFFLPFQYQWTGMMSIQGVLSGLLTYLI